MNYYQGGTCYHENDDNTVSVMSGGEVIETFESSGCIYNDLGCCQGCPECYLDALHRYDED
ncbi:hypothetical protein ACTQZS_08115 [Bilifractor sp. LCP19S3_H10]|uniref:hypothetical protein n=1 Tax=Bilifractor sp. LCP19S3_H10 TaxID=3438736 RepID=UPI003F91411D